MNLPAPRKILVVDDEQNLSAALRELLREEGFDVTVSESIASARASDIESFDLVILDWTLPDGQGIDLLKYWRGRGSEVPVVMLTARSQLIDKVIGLELGADDYMTKPFEPRELIARVRTRLRNQGRNSQLPRNPPATFTGTIIKAGDFEMHVERHEVLFRGRREELTKMEWGLLRLFLENPNRVYSREELLNSVWGMENFPTTRTVDNHVLQLRQKFGQELFETVRGVGYRFCAPAEDFAKK